MTQQHNNQHCRVANVDQNLFGGCATETAGQIVASEGRDRLV